MYKKMLAEILVKTEKTDQGTSIYAFPFFAKVISYEEAIPKSDIAIVTSRSTGYRSISFISTGDIIIFDRTVWSETGDELVALNDRCFTYPRLDGGEVFGFIDSGSGFSPSLVVKFTNSYTIAFDMPISSKGVTTFYRVETIDTRYTGNKKIKRWLNQLRETGFYFEKESFMSGIHKMKYVNNKTYDLLLKFVRETTDMTCDEAMSVSLLRAMSRE